MAKRGENIYKRKDGRYEGRYIKGRKVDGKPIFGYIYAYTYSEVKTRLVQVKAAANNDKSIRIIGKGTLSDFLYYWLENITKERVKESTYARYCERIYGYIIPALGDLTIYKISKAQIQNFVDGLSNKGLAPSTVVGITQVLCSSMKKASELNLTKTNPCLGIILPSVNIKEASALDRSEQIKIEQLAISAGTSLELGVFLSLYTGVRIGEVCALRWRDIDFFTETIAIRNTVQRIKNFGNGEAKTMLLEDAPKSKRSLRRIPLPAEIADKLRHYSKGIPSDYYILSGSAKMMEPRTLRAQFHKITAKAGLPIPFHTLRHTYATRCLEHNFDIQTLSELLGHANATITMRVYAHSVFEHKKLLTSRIQILSKNYKPSNEPSAIAAVY